MMKLLIISSLLFAPMAASSAEQVLNFSEQTNLRSVQEKNEYTPLYTSSYAIENESDANLLFEKATIHNGISCEEAGNGLEYRDLVRGGIIIGSCVRECDSGRTSCRLDFDTFKKH